VEKGLQQDQMSIKKHEACKNSVDGRCSCKTEKGQRDSTEVQILFHSILFYGVVAFLTPRHGVLTQCTAMMDVWDLCPPLMHLGKTQ